MSFSKSVASLLLSYFLALIFSVDEKLTIYLIALLTVYFIYRSRHSLAFLILHVTSLNLLLYAASLQSLPSYVNFSFNDLYRAVLYFSLFAIASSLLFLDISIFNIEQAYVARPHSPRNISLAASLYILSLLLIVLQGRTYSYSTADPAPSLKSLNSFYDYSFVLLSSALFYSGLLFRRFSNIFILALPVLFVDLYSGRRVGLAGVICILLFAHALKHLGTMKWQRLGYLLYIPFFVPIFFALKIIGSFRLLSSGERFEISLSYLCALIFPSDASSTEIQSLFTTSHYFAIDHISHGFYSLFDPTRHFFSSFIGASSFDMIGIVVNNKLFTLGGILPVAAFSSIPVLIYPLFLLVSFLLLALYIYLLRFFGVTSLSIFLVLVITLPRSILYNFAVLPRSLLILLFISLSTALVFRQSLDARKT
jgi:hypothetical protein